MTEDNKEEILIEIKIDKPVTEQQIDKLTESIENLKRSNQELQKEQIALTKAGKENSKEYIENAKQMELNRFEINKASAERKNLISAIKAEDNSLQAIKARLSANKQEIQNINTANKEGKKRYDELTEAIKADTEALLVQEKKQGSFFRQVGKYPDALNAVTGGFYGAAEGAAGLGKQLWALVANPIGAIIAAIAAVLLLVASYFKNSGDGADFFDKKMKQVEAIVSVVIDRLSALVRGLIAIASGDLKGGIEQIQGAFEGVGDELEREIQLAGELAEAIDALGDAERKFAVSASESTNEIKRLVLESKNRTLTEQQRQALLDKALELERKRVGELNELKEESLRIAVKEAEQRANTQQKVNESLTEYAKRLMDVDTLADEFRDAIKDALIAQQDAIGESLAFQEKIENAKDALAQKAAEKAQKAKEEREKQQEEELEKYIKGLKEREEREQEELRMAAEATAELRAMERDVQAEEEDKKREKEFEALEQQAMQELGFMQEVQDEKAQMLNDYDELHNDTTAKRLERERKAAEKEKQIDRNKNEAIKGGIELLTKERSTARIAMNLVFKQDAIREATINTYDAAIAAYKSLAGIPIVGPALGAIAAGVVTAFGFAQVAKIAGIQFARGGRANKAGTTGGNLHSAGGTRYYGEDGHVVELERDENWYVLNRSASREINRLSDINVRHGGADFSTSNRAWQYAAGGMVETRSAMQSAQGIDVAQIVAETVANVPIFVTVEDINAGQARVNSIQQKAQVI